jgi:hypothetical protein
VGKYKSVDCALKEESGPIVFAGWVSLDKIGLPNLPLPTQATTNPAALSGSARTSKDRNNDCRKVTSIDLAAQSRWAKADH